MIDDIETLGTWEQRKYKAQQLIETILVQADFFEMKTRTRPTVFMSPDLFQLIAAYSRDLIVSRLPKDQTANTICGYDLEILYDRKELLYVGYKVLL